MIFYNKIYLMDLIKGVQMDITRVKKVIRKSIIESKAIITREKIMILLGLILAFVFGISFLLTPVLNREMRKGIQMWRLPCGMIIFILAAIFILGLIRIVINTSKVGDTSTLIYSGKTLFWKCFIINVLLGIGYLLVFYPGTGMYDTLAILSEGLECAQQHPWFYILFVRFLVRLSLILGGGYELALVMESIVQILLTAGTYSYCLYWIHNKGLYHKIWLIIAVFYICSPFLGITMVNLFKDIPYSLLLVAWIPVLYDYWESEGKSLQKKNGLFKVVIFLLLSLLRNNGIYVSIFLLLSMVIIFPLKWKKCCLFLSILILIIMGNHIFQKWQRIEPMFQEMVGIPLQQVGGVVYYNGKMTEEQRAFISEIIAPEEIQERYDPYIADRLKWAGGDVFHREFLDGHKRQFIKTWADMLVPNFKIYVTVYLRNTYNFWSLDNSQGGQCYTSIYVPAFEEWLKKENISIKTVFPKDLQQKIESILTPLIEFCGEGTAFWIFILFWFLIGLQRGWKALIVGAPVIGNWLTIMISTPIFYQWRYVLCVAMALPLIIGIAFLEKDEGILTKEY